MKLLISITIISMTITSASAQTSPQRVLSLADQVEVLTMKMLESSDLKTQSLPDLQKRLVKVEADLARQPVQTYPGLTPGTPPSQFDAESLLKKDLICRMEVARLIAKVTSLNADLEKAREKNAPLQDLEKTKMDLFNQLSEKIVEHDENDLRSEALEYISTLYEITLLTELGAKKTATYSDRAFHNCVVNYKTVYQTITAPDDEAKMFCNKNGIKTSAVADATPEEFSGKPIAETVTPPAQTQPSGSNSVDFTSAASAISSPH